MAFVIGLLWAFIQDNPSLSSNMPIYILSRLGLHSWRALPTLASCPGQLIPQGQGLFLLILNQNYCCCIWRLLLHSLFFNRQGEALHCYKLSILLPLVSDFLLHIHTELPSLSSAALGPPGCQGSTSPKCLYSVPSRHHLQTSIWCSIYEFTYSTLIQYMSWTRRDCDQKAISSNNPMLDFSEQSNFKYYILFPNEES